MPWECRTGVEKRIAGTAAIVEIGRRGERQGTAATTGFAILVLTESLRKRNWMREHRLWMGSISN